MLSAGLSPRPPEATFMPHRKPGQTTSKINEKAGRIARAESPCGENIFAQNTDFFLDSPPRHIRPKGHAKAAKPYSFQGDSAGRITLCRDKAMRQPAMSERPNKKPCRKAGPVQGGFMLFGYRPARMVMAGRAQAAFYQLARISLIR